MDKRKNFINGIWFDSDGTLVDSLPAHILFLNDLNEEYKLGLKLPSQTDRVSMEKMCETPMDAFFLRAGFLKEDVNKFLEIYKTKFCTDSKYVSKPFEGIEELISYLKRSGVSPLAVISSNYETNLRRDLGPLFNCFDKVVDKNYLDRFCKGSKGIALNTELLMLDNPWPYSYFYIGDTESDFRAAQFSGVNFIGVGYGWQIKKKGEEKFPVAETPKKLMNLIKQTNELGYSRCEQSHQYRIPHTS
ncbi:MAG TPA: HAD hydrolase-like protein [Candidatus Paceibacterota bacterium]|nr:HAD hydrolase-like protein [Candidatus Paceibacterota bacterium]